jgi:hypothetical protein
MAVLFDIINYMQAQEDRKIRMEREEVRFEAERRAANKIAEKEGVANAVRKSLDETATALEASQRDLDAVQKQWFEAQSKGMLSAEQNELYRNAVRKASGDLEFNQSKYRELTMQRGHLDGTLNKTIAESSKPMFDKIFDPKKDPYDQIKETRTTKTIDPMTGSEAEVSQTGPASVFSQQSAYAPNQGSQYQAPPTATSLLGFTPSGYEPDPEAVTPEISYRAVRNQGGITSERDTAGATPVDPAATLPNPNPIASQMTNPAVPAPKTGGFVRVRNKATGETGVLPTENANSAIASGRFERVP